MVIGKRLNTTQKMAGVSQQELGEEPGVSRMSKFIICLGPSRQG